MSATSEAVVELLSLANGKGWSFLGVEWAASDSFLPSLLQRPSLLDDFNDIDPRQQLVDEVLRYSAQPPNLTEIATTPAVNCLPPLTRLAEMPLDDGAHRANIGAPLKLRLQ